MKLKKLFFFSFLLSFILIYSVFPLFVGHTDEETINKQLLKLGYPNEAYIISNGTMYYNDGRKADLNPPEYYPVSAYEAYNLSVNYVNTEYGEYFGQTFRIDIDTLEETPDYWTFKFIFGEGSKHSGYVTVNRLSKKVSLHALNEN